MADETEEQFQASYRLSHAIGEGGAGEVWLATQMSLGRPVVIKFLRTDVADELALLRFEREARVLSRLSHPHIVPIYHYGSRAGRPYLVMEHVEGGTLADRLGRTALDDLSALRFAIGVADGLDCLHRQGIVHRDIKPANILITGDGTPKLGDFGLARRADEPTMSNHGPLLGTAHYVAPEVLLGGDPSPASDLYALGVVLYQMLARRFPWPDHADVSQLIAQRINQPPEPLDRWRDDLPRPLSVLVNRLLIADEKCRPSDAAEVRLQLEELTEASFGRLRPIAHASTPREVPNDKTMPLGTAVLPPPPAPKPPANKTPARPKPVAAPREAASAPRRSASPGRAIVAPLGLLACFGLLLALTRLREPSGTTESPPVAPSGTPTSTAARPPPRTRAPVQKLVALARDVQAAGLSSVLETMDMKRASARQPADWAPVQQALDRVRWAARRDELAPFVAESRLDGDLSTDERRAVYRAASDLRVLDRYAEAHQLPARTGVERTVPRDLAWSDTPLFAHGPPAAYTPFPRHESLMPANEDHVNFWNDGPSFTDAITVTLPVPPLDGVRRAQLALKVSRNRATGYLLESASFAVPLLLVPETAKVFLPEAVTMYHAVPLSWLKVGPMPVTLRLIVLPGFYKNARGEGTMKYSDIRSNCPVPEELSLHLDGAR